MKMYSANIRQLCKVFNFIINGILPIITTTVLAKPTLTFTLSPATLTAIPSFSAYTQQYVERKHADQMKTYSFLASYPPPQHSVWYPDDIASSQHYLSPSYDGVRLRNDSLIMVYYHDQTVAIVELGPEKLLLSCELIEIYNDNEGTKLLSRLSYINRPLGISFKDMLKLMNQCEIVDKQRRPYGSIGDINVANPNTNSGGGIFPQNPLSLLSGIIPGTKWCGTGDIATTYSDLGSETIMDRCCRAHDLCPVKVRAYQKRYNLVNNSLYTKSHCVCDDMLFSCLKKTNTSAAQVMGSIYFNLVQVPCLQDTTRGREFRKAREGF